MRLSLMLIIGKDVKGIDAKSRDACNASLRESLCG